MTATLAACGLVALAAVLLAAGTPDGDRLTRRACLRLAVLGASGLSLLPSCLLNRKAAWPDGHSPDNGDAGALLAKWARLGKVWREMGGHLKGRLGDTEREAEFEKLKAEMTAALDALPAWPELRVVFEERWAHIHRERYVMATCYDMPAGGPLPARAAVEEQVKELQQLVAEGRLSTEAAARAARILGVQGQYLTGLRKAEQAAGDGRQWEVWRELWRQYEADEIEAGPGSQLAGQRLAELTVDSLGWLAGPVRENEGTPADDGQTEDGEEATE